MKYKGYKTIMHMALILMAGMGAVACYEPVDLSTEEEVEVPWVHCILTPDSTQWLEFRIFSNDGPKNGQGVNEAKISLYEKLGDNSDYRLLAEFENAGDGLWCAETTAEARRSYRLVIERPGKDTLNAYTRMPAYNREEHFNYVSGFDMAYDHHTDIYYVADQDNEYYYTVMIDGHETLAASDSPWYLREKSDPFSEMNRYRFDHTRFVLSAITDVQSAIWCYKVGWSEARRSWYVEDNIATNQEAHVDGYNLTGSFFTQSEMPEALAQFPDVAGKPLHYRYLRFPAGSLSMTDTIAVSGDFSGTHYGDARPGVIISLEEDRNKFNQVAGLPLRENIFTTGHAGYINFKMVSLEYDQYLKDVAEYELLQEVGTDIIAIYGNTNHYTNIQGGVGIFGAEVDNKLYWSCGAWRY